MQLYHDHFISPLSFLVYKIHTQLRGSDSELVGEGGTGGGGGVDGTTPAVVLAEMIMGTVPLSHPYMTTEKP